VAKVWVVNASPLITLAKVGRLDLLTDPDRTVIVPSAVVDEVLAGPEGDPARLAFETSPPAEIRVAPSDPAVLAWNLGLGESAVLSLARTTNTLAVIDDLEARVAARVLGVRFTGTLGLVVQAVRAGREAAAAPVVRALRDAGLRLSDQAVADALQRYLGEKWEP
jgi:predicted nucleic acid-binding protein